MSSTLTFANLVMSLRAPRVAIAVDDDQWVAHTMSAVRTHSQLWGGAGNTVIVATDGQLHPAVARALKAYDPDYVTKLGITLSEREALYPGLQRLVSEGEEITDPDERAKFIAQIEEYNQGVHGYSLSNQTMAALREPLTSFVEEDGEPRIDWLHHSQIDQFSLSGVENSQPFHDVSTGDPVLDLAVALKRGLPLQSAGTLVLGTDFTESDVSKFLVSPILSDDTSPFGQTIADLAHIRSGYHRDAEPLVVLGRTSADMSLAATVDRHHGSTYWLPFTAADTGWFMWVGMNLLNAGRRYVRRIQVTSASLSQDECMDLFEKIRNGSGIKWPTDEMAVGVSYCPPDEVPLHRGKLTWRVNDRWELRSTPPVTDDGDGVHLSTPAPVQAPDWYSTTPRRWITDVHLARRRVHPHPALKPEQLLGPDSEQYETFTRVSGDSLAFESARWSFVAAGASIVGQLAAPQLRWPGLRETLNAAAQAAGSLVRASAPGQNARLTATMWGGRDRLVADLLPGRRPLVDRLLTERGENAPLEKESAVGLGNPRIRMHNRCLVPFGAFKDCVDVDVRAWLDERLVTGAIRTGLTLSCSVCPWVDFYPIDDVGTNFTCSRCGSVNPLVHSTWRKPNQGPIWYYELHPTAVEFFNQNGHGPLLAVHHHAASNHSDLVEFELEFAHAKNGRSWCEIDFAILGRDGLVIGEAKTNGNIVGSNTAERVAAVEKTLRAAKVVDAVEVCFATTGTWSSTAMTAFKRAVETQRPAAKLTLLENIDSTRATTGVVSPRRK